MSMSEQHRPENNQLAIRDKNALGNPNGTRQPNDNLNRALAGIERKRKREVTDNDSAEERDQRRIRLLQDTTRQNNGTKSDRGLNREISEEANNRLHGDNVTQAEQLAKITGYYSSPVESSPPPNSYNELAKFARQMELSQTIELKKANALILQQEQVRVQNMLGTDEASTQTSKPTDRQVGDNRVLPSNETLQEGATKPIENTERRVLSDITNIQNVSQIIRTIESKQSEERVSDFFKPTPEEEAKQQVRDMLAKQEKQKKQEVIPVQTSMPTNPMDQSSTKHEDPDDSKAKSTKDKDKNIVDPDKDEFSNAPNLDYQYPKNPTLDAAQLNDSLQKVRT